MKNPFPGMNPYLQEHWADVHTGLITYIRDRLQDQLPDDLVARSEESVSIDDRVSPVTYRADVGVREPWRADEPPAPCLAGDDGVAIAEPMLVRVDPETQRWVAILDVGGRLVTAIEVLSPSNKTEEGSAAYRRKQQDYLAAGANLVELDLLRGGRHALAVPLEKLPVRRHASGMVCISRAAQPAQREIYAVPLQEPLPSLRIPLRPADCDVVLELQPLINQVHERGRYGRLDYRRNPEPPLRPDDTEWLGSILRPAGLR